MRRTLALLLTTGTAAALAAAPAHAATVSARSIYLDAYKGSGDWSTTVTVQAAPGERNVLDVTSAAGLVSVRDVGAPLTAADDCTLSGDTVTCPVKSRYSLATIDVHAGDGDDSVRVNPDAAGSYGQTLHASANLFGDDGNDVLEAGGHLVGGPGDDTLTAVGTIGTTLDGGTGRDRMTGQPGPSDSVTYADRTAPVTVRLGTASGNGEAGEDDAIAGIEDVVGGAGADTIIGDDGPNQVMGGAGADHVEGLGGDDALYGANLAGDAVGAGDTLLGGDGADRISVGPHGLADGGAGDDALTIVGAAHAIGGTGRDQVVLGGDGATVDLVDGEADTLTCNAYGPPPVLHLDAIDQASSCTPPPPARVVASIDAHPTARRGIIVAVRLTCPPDIRGGCTVRTTLRTGPRAAVSSRARTRIRKGRTAIAHLTLSPTAARTLRRAGTLSATVTISARDAAGDVHTQRRALRMRRQRR